jgi:protein-disulfide isomerase
MRPAAVLVALTTAMAAIGPAAAAELVYFHETGCPYCRQWEEEVLPAYPKTEEGQRLPLRPIKSSDAWPEDLDGVGVAAFTPTFIVVTDDGDEIGRIIGYQPHFFWAQLDALIDKLPPDQ